MNKVNQQNVFPVCNKGLVDYLISKGYRLKRRDEKNEYRGIKKDIYYFYEPEKVKKEMQDYYVRNRMDWVTTSTWQLFEVIDSQMVEIAKVALFNNLFMETDTVDINDFLYSLEVLNDSVLFEGDEEYIFEVLDMILKKTDELEGEAQVNSEKFVVSL